MVGGIAMRALIWGLRKGTSQGWPHCSLATHRGLGTGLAPWDFLQKFLYSVPFL